MYQNQLYILQALNNDLWSFWDFSKHVNDIEDNENYVLNDLNLFNVFVIVSLIENNRSILFYFSGNVLILFGLYLSFCPFPFASVLTNFTLSYVCYYVCYMLFIFSYSKSLALSHLSSDYFRFSIWIFQIFLIFVRSLYFTPFSFSWVSLPSL